MKRRRESPFRDCRRCDRCDHRWSSCPLSSARLGYVSVLAGAALGYCTIKGYEILGKKLTKKGVVVSAILMVLTVFLVNQLDYTLALMSELDLPFDMSWTLLNEATFSGDVPDKFYLNLALLAVFTLGWCLDFGQISSGWTKEIVPLLVNCIMNDKRKV